MTEYIFDADLTPQEVTRVRLRRWIGLAASIIGTAAVAELFFSVFPGLEHQRAANAAIFAGILAMATLMADTLTPKLAKRKQERSFRLVIDGDTFTSFAFPRKTITLNRSEILEAQHTPIGELWLVTASKSRRIIVPAGLPQMEGLSAELSAHGIRFTSPSRWWERHLLPQVFGAFCLSAATVGMLKFARPLLALVSGLILVAVVWLQFCRVRQGKKPGFSSDAVGWIALVALVVFVVVTYRYFH